MNYSMLRALEEAMRLEQLGLISHADFVVQTAHLTSIWWSEHDAV